MSIQKIELQKQKVDDLERQVSQKKEESDRINDALAVCSGKLSQYADARKSRRRGVIWLIVAGLLAVAEVLLLLEIIPGYSDFQVIDLVIIGIPLFLGIKNLRSTASLPQESVEELNAQQQKLWAEREQTDLSRAEHELKTARDELDKLTRYTGRDWDFSTFRATPENIAAMEEDFESLLIALKYSKDVNFKINCWLSANEIKRATAEFGNQKGTVAAYDRGTKAIKASGSWKLEVALIAMSVLTVTILNAAVYYGCGDSATFEELMAKSNVRKPRNEEEEALLALTGEVMPDLAATIRNGLSARR